MAGSCKVTTRFKRIPLGQLVDGSGFLWGHTVDGRQLVGCDAASCAAASQHKLYERVIIGRRGAAVVPRRVAPA